MPLVDNIGNWLVFIEQDRAWRLPACPGSDRRHAVSSYENERAGSRPPRSWRRRPCSRRFGRDALHLAWSKDITVLLPAHGADADAHDDAGQSPLHGLPDEDAIRPLLLHGADANARSNLRLGWLEPLSGPKWFERKLLAEHCEIDKGTKRTLARVAESDQQIVITFNCVLDSTEFQEGFRLAAKCLGNLFVRRRVRRRVVARNKLRPFRDSLEPHLVSAAMFQNVAKIKSRRRPRFPT
jgi:hypothetical protein